jgi:hypothetical protein
MAPNDSTADEPELEPEPDECTDSNARTLMRRLAEVYEDALSWLDREGLAQFARAENEARELFRQMLRAQRQARA